MNNNSNKKFNIIKSKTKKNNKELFNNFQLDINKIRNIPKGDDNITGDKIDNATNTRDTRDTRGSSRRIMIQKKSKEEIISDFANRIKKLDFDKIEEMDKEKINKKRKSYEKKSKIKNIGKKKV